MFIVFEGLDGSGKTTQSRLFAEALTWRNADGTYRASPRNVHWCAEPRSKSAVRELVGDVRAPLQRARAQALAYATDRHAHAEDLIERLQGGEIVVCDRYVHSSLAYQREAGRRFVQSLQEGVPLPDVVVWLAVSPKCCLERIQARNKVTLSEEDAHYTEEKLCALHEAYRDVLQTSPAYPETRVLKVPGHGTVRAVHQRVLKGYYKLVTEYPECVPPVRYCPGDGLEAALQEAQRELAVQREVLLRSDIVCDWGCTSDTSAEELCDTCQLYDEVKRDLALKKEEE